MKRYTVSWNKISRVDKGFENTTGKLAEIVENILPREPQIRLDEVHCMMLYITCYLFREVFSKSQLCFCIMNIDSSY